MQMVSQALDRSFGRLARSTRSNSFVRIEYKPRRVWPRPLPGACRKRSWYASGSAQRAACATPSSESTASVQCAGGCPLSGRRWTRSRRRLADWMPSMPSCLIPVPRCESREYLIVNTSTPSRMSLAWSSRWPARSSSRGYPMLRTHQGQGQCVPAAGRFCRPVQCSFVQRSARQLGFKVG